MMDLGGNPDLTVVVVTHNSATDLRCCLGSIPPISGGGPTHIIVWDNASVDDSVAVAAEHGCEVLSSPVNVGFAKACNQAADSASTRWVMFLNPDATPELGFFERLSAQLSALDPNHPVLIGPELVNPDDSVQVSNPALPEPRPEIFYALIGGRAARLAHKANAAVYLSGACLITSTSTWRELGGFDERYFLYGEDADLSHRAHDLGIELRLERELRVRHRGSQGLAAKSSASLRLLIAGKVSYFDRFHGRLAARSVAVAYRVGAGLRYAAAQVKRDHAQARLWRSLARMTWSEMIWFGRDLPPVRVLAWPGLRHTDRNPYTLELYRAMRAKGADIGDLRQPLRLLAGADVVHFHWPEAGLNTERLHRAIWGAARILLFARISKARGSTVLWTVHNLAPHDNRYPRLAQLFYWVWVRSVGALIFNSDVSRRQAIRSWPRLAYVPTLISELPSYRGLHDPSESRSDSRTRLGLRPDDRLVLFVGHLRRYKQVEALIGPMASLLQGDSRLHLAIAGSAPDEGYLDELKRMIADLPRVTLVPTHLEPSEVGNLLQAADLFVLPLERALNSSSVMLGLSYGVTTLAPATPTNVELSGRGYGQALCLYEPPLDSDVIISALNRPRVDPLAAMPPDFATVAMKQLAFMRQLTGMSQE